MTTAKRQFTLRMQPENIEKIKYIAAVNKRSMAMQLEYWAEQHIADYESKFGKISFDGTSKQNLIQQNNFINNGTNVLSIS